jgi:hypothetical protein
MDVGDWLRSLGLDQYEATFRANEIDADVLPELTEIDLEKLGVPLGHRKRLLKAIAGLAAAEKLAPTLALQLRFLLTSESMGHHDSEDHGWREHRSRRRLSFGHRRYGM